MHASQMLLGIDTGGTFTDFVLLDIQAGQVSIHKVLSTPEAPSRAIFQGIDEMGLQETLQGGLLLVVHGSTVATNAALERKGVKTAYITNTGFADVLTLARQTRAELYNLTPRPETPPVPKELCFEVAVRRTHDNQIISPLTEDIIQQLVDQLIAAQPVAVAINLLFSYVNDEDEKRLESALTPHFYVARSSFIHPQDGEYERGITTWLSAWLGPLMHTYLQALSQRLFPSRLAIMQSSGGTIDAENASRRAANLLLSGPAGGLAAARYIGQITGKRKLITFDMGGTSTDVALIDGEIRVTHQGQVAGYPVAAPMVDMHTIGAGGGSIAWLDEGGMLQVGPDSAGASPGPICYGRGGNALTVTDANVFMGRILPDQLLGGSLPLEISRVQEAMQRLADQLNLSVIRTAQGILEVANEHMIGALRKISVHKGFDPRAFTLCCFGGAGGLHVCALAEALEIRSILVPIHSGVLSALGMIVAPKERRLSRSLIKRLDQVTVKELLTAFENLVQQAQRELSEEAVAIDQILLHREVALRYLGQRFSLSLPITTNLTKEAGWQNRLAEEFHKAHALRYGHRMDRPVEVAMLKLHATVPAHEINLPVDTSPLPLKPSPLQDYRVLTDGTRALRATRDQIPADNSLPGPMIIVDSVSTLYVQAGWRVHKDGFGNLHLQYQGNDREDGSKTNKR